MSDCCYRTEAIFLGLVHYIKNMGLIKDILLDGGTFLMNTHTHIPSTLLETFTHQLIHGFVQSAIEVTAMHVKSNI